MRSQQKYSKTSPTRFLEKLLTLECLFVLSLLGALVVPKASFGRAHHFVSTRIGGGYTLADGQEKKLSTLHNYTSLRLGIDPQMKEPLFWGLELESFRVQRSPTQFFDRHQYGEAALLVLGIQVPQYSIWLSSGIGRLRVLSIQNDDAYDIDRRYRMHTSAVGASYAIYQRTLAKVELQTELKILTTERSWRQRYRYKHLRFFSILWAITIIDI